MSEQKQSKFIEHLENGFTKEHEGKTVTIRQWDDMVREFGENEHGFISPSDTCHFISDMLGLCGNTYKIESTHLYGICSLIDISWVVAPYMTEEYWKPNYKDEKTSLDNLDTEYLGDYPIQEKEKEEIRSFYAKEPGYEHKKDLTFSDRLIKQANDLTNLVAEKNKAYGNSFKESNRIIEILYPEGVQKDQYQDMLLITRVIDKLFRIATKKDAFGENPWKDIMGYALLAVVDQMEEDK